MTSSLLRALMISILIGATLYMAYGTPRPHYQSTSIIKTINLPDDIKGWKGSDVKQQLNLGQDQYFFIGDIKTKKYVNAQGLTIYFTLLDASNFHYPKVCFTGGGYEPIDLPDTKIGIANGNFKIPTIFFKKPNEDVLVMYWLCINQQRVSWAGQKLKELWFSIWGTKRTGFTVRIDIPVSQQYIKPAVAAAQDLVKALNHSLPEDQKDYIFGK